MRTCNLQISASMPMQCFSNTVDQSWLPLKILVRIMIYKWCEGNNVFLSSLFSFFFFFVGLLSVIDSTKLGLFFFPPFFSLLSVGTYVQVPGRASLRLHLRSVSSPMQGLSYLRWKLWIEKVSRTSESSGFSSDFRLV